MHRLLAHAVALLAALLVLSPAAAQLRVEITGVGSNQFPVSVASFTKLWKLFIETRNQPAAAPAPALAG